MAEVDFTGSTVTQLQDGLEEIASLAMAARRLALDAGQLSGPDASLSALLCSAQVVAEKIGFVADLCSKKIDGSIAVGGAENWMMSPRYLQTLSAD